MLDTETTDNILKLLVAVGIFLVPLATFIQTIRVGKRAETHDAASVVRDTVIQKEIQTVNGLKIGALADAIYDEQIRLARTTGEDKAAGSGG